jgi:hypothetical protein
MGAGIRTAAFSQPIEIAMMLIPHKDKPRQNNIAESSAGNMAKYNGHEKSPIAVPITKPITIGNSGM